MVPWPRHMIPPAPIAAAPKPTIPAPPTARRCAPGAPGAKHGIPPLPAASPDVAAFLAAGRDAGQAGNTLKLRAAAIRFLHRAAGLPSPTDTAEVSETMAGIRRDAPNPQKKRAATLAVLRELLAPIPDDFPGLRDRALLLVGFAGALRRSELAGILRADLQRTDQGYELTLQRSKGSRN